MIKFLDALGGFGDDRQTGFVDTFWNQLTQPQLSEEDRAFLEKERNRIDEKYCGGPCRFMNLETVVEQETRAQMHLRNFAFTAGIINRTLVLPNVANSRIGACKEYDFEYYYDIQWAKDNAEHFKYITMQEFIDWLDERKSHGVPANDQIMTIHDILLHPNPKPTITEPHCLSEYTMPKSKYDKVMSWDIYSSKILRTGENQLVQFLQGPEKENVNTEVLHISLNKGNPFSHHPLANDPIPYSPQLRTLADKTAQSMSPYVAVHWRMETVRRSANLVHCSEHLIDTLQMNPIYKNHTVFLLTDYPHRFTEEQQLSAINGTASAEELKEWVVSTSDTFRPDKIKSNNHLAIRYLYTHRPFTLFETIANSTHDHEVNNWTVLPIPIELQKLSTNENQTGLYDTGWVGILDKLMAIRSNHFFAGKSGVCARKSTFTKQIMDERSALSLGNIHYFGH
ncbi:uncharacterized protein EV154DRAFT_409994 [Mucor mucedo]|uniref:uncharacterized protein n=1 Tax=Mucor mucedo TaxID=29922 RepID=UPI0022209A52|nr:uncharacterized protein EV154DRAFT_409994 [Mucor mucedo]KAI7897388.1 hypothetical protein EV154DRAFT_409994 [Mucor mucedo]